MTLSHDTRYRRRLRLRTDGGREFLLDLPQAVMLRDGDGLALEGGEWITIHAANERLAEITCVDRQLLPRIAWHLGNRHVPTVVEEDRLLIQNDSVIIDMVRRLGALVRFVEAPFYPEGGAYEIPAASPDSHLNHGHDQGQRRQKPLSMDRAALYRLLTWCSPAFPVGAYSYSHGLEYAVEEGLVKDRESLTGWIGTLLSHGNGMVDGALFCAAWRAASVGDVAGLKNITELASAFRSTREIALESAAQGEAFAMTVQTAWNVPLLAELADGRGVRVVYPVAVSVACAAVGIPLDPALQAYLHAFAANLVSAGIRLIPLGQTDGQIAMVALESIVMTSAQKAMETPLDELGTATPMMDWASMRHETQHTRLFRS